MDIKKLVTEIINYYTEFDYDKLSIEYLFSLEGSFNFFVSYIKNNELKEALISDRPIRDTVRKMSDKFEKFKNSDQKFNNVKIEIDPDGTFTEKYWWDAEKAKQDLLESAQVFYQGINEVMMSMLFEYEKENNLLPTKYDDDGDLEYLSSWDSGVFTFHITEQNELVYKISLTKDGKQRMVDMPLKAYFVEAILYHHKITNTELSDVWQPWNTMILKSLHNNIPYDKREEFVSYTLE